MYWKKSFEKHVFMTFHLRNQIHAERDDGYRDELSIS
jgi:hypothetical protein